MNIGINNNVIISNQVIKYEQNSIVQNTNKSTNDLNNANNLEQIDIIDISEGSVLAYEFANRFKEATGYTSEVKLSKEFLLEKNDYDDSFIKDFAIEYYNIKQEFSSNSSKVEFNKHMNLVDKVYEDVVNEAADSLSRVFENFFDYSSNVSKSYKLKSDDGVFDKKSFKEHLKLMAKNALNTVKNADINADIDTLNNDIEKNLQKISGNDLSNMSYKDIKILSNLFENLPSLSLPLIGKIDEQLMNKKERIWSNAIENLDDNLSKNIKDAVIKSGNKNIKAFEKIGNFLNMREDLNNELDKLNKLLSKLVKQRKIMTKHMDNIAKINSLKKDVVNKRTIQLMKQITDLDNNINTLVERISSIETNLESISDNPNKIELNLGNEEVNEK